MRLCRTEGWQPAVPLRKEQFSTTVSEEDHERSDRNEELQLEATHFTGVVIAIARSPLGYIAVHAVNCTNKRRLGRMPEPSLN